jgi:hypothetical protein
MIPMLASAQTDGSPHWGQGYAFIGEGANSFDGGTLGIFQAGGGAEAGLVKGLAAGGEIGYMEYNRSNSPGKWGVFSLDPSYHFLPTSGKSSVVPFLECGYTRMFSNYFIFPSAANLFNVGAGIHFWASKRAGIRLEFRDHYLPGALGHTQHFYGLRIGLAFR